MTQRMTPDQIANSYSQIASYWDGEDFNRANGIAPHEHALRFVEQKRRAIDIGCGSSGRLIDLMLGHNFITVEGLDISPEMIRLARARHPDVTFHPADIRTWEPASDYDFISAWDSIWHVPLEDHEAVLGKLCDALAPGGVLIFTSGGVDQPGEVCNPFLGQPLYTAAPGIPALLEITTQHGCVCRHLEYDQLPELHLYLIVQKRTADE